MSQEIPMTADGKRWQAESDARTLIDAAAINVDPTRKRAALKQAKKIATEKQAEAKAAKKVAARKPTTRKVKRTTRKK